jgi:hypothetical protein
MSMKDTIAAVLMVCSGVLTVVGAILVDANGKYHWLSSSCCSRLWAGSNREKRSRLRFLKNRPTPPIDDES